MKDIKIVVSLFASLLLLGSCTNIRTLDFDDVAQEALLQRDKKKWAEEAEALKKNKEDSARIADENKKLYETYLDDLRAYKKGDHLMMFGWFAYWNPTSPDNTFNLDKLPDSVDFVSNWGGWSNLSSAHLEQLSRMKEKGTRMTIGWIIENVGSGFHKGMLHPDWSEDPYKAIEQYAKAICDTIAKYDYDGFDLDYEPQFASPWGGMHCGKNWDKEWTHSRPLISCQRDSNKEYENYFFRKMREYLPEGKLFNINGSLGWIDPSVLHLFDYFIAQSYHGAASSWYQIAIDRGIDPKKIIVTETFQTNKPNADKFVDRYAKYATAREKLGAKIGGIGAFHINEDYLHGPNYKNVREAIQVMNPAFTDN